MKTSQKSHQAGFSLLEVLVGLVILAIGLLGLAGMQMVSLKQNNEAYLRSQATFHAYDILDKMRANRVLALDEHYITSFDQSPDSAVLPGVVYNDLVAWKTSLQSVFPGPGKGSIAMTNGTMVNVTITWRETSDQNATAWQTFTTQTEL
ncbi:type IV pilus modification protein PilV [Desulfonatronum thioautotrophicum]|uniref:type IV pilus modification protein PilV n=1 Tax=Desulfonatronum thioautotrophicum TaxID=617001 RepID=UPI0005EBDD07|nr:type IV pilus modification protein PilV [Desulfonatronum thioautotrophicum]